jgi:hypothetical protein
MTAALMKAAGMTYPERIPATVPLGQVLVHNTVRPARRQGTRGFRYWLQAPADNLEVCPCGWAPEVPEHYRVHKAPGEPKWLKPSSR